VKGPPRCTAYRGWRLPDRETWQAMGAGRNNRPGMMLLRTQGPATVLAGAVDVEGGAATVARPREADGGSQQGGDHQQPNNDYRRLLVEVNPLKN